MENNIQKNIEDQIPKSKGNHVEYNSRKDKEDDSQKKMGAVFVATDCWDLVDPKDGSVLVDGLNRLRTGADHFLKTEIAREGLKVWMDVFRELQGNEIWTTHSAWIEKVKPVFGPDIAARFFLGC